MQPRIAVTRRTVTATPPTHEIRRGRTAGGAYRRAPWSTSVERTTRRDTLHTQALPGESLEQYTAPGRHRATPHPTKRRRSSTGRTSSPPNSSPIAPSTAVFAPPQVQTRGNGAPASRYPRRSQQRHQAHVQAAGAILPQMAADSATRATGPTIDAEHRDRRRLATEGACRGCGKPNAAPRCEVCRPAHARTTPAQILERKTRAAESRRDLHRMRRGGSRDGQQRCSRCAAKRRAQRQKSQPGTRSCEISSNWRASSSALLDTPSPTFQPSKLHVSACIIHRAMSRCHIALKPNWGRGRRLLPGPPKVLRMRLSGTVAGEMHRVGKT